MSDTICEIACRRINDEKRAQYVGTAQIRLDALTFPYSSDLDLSKVERLKKFFREKHGCNSTDLQNRIPAVVDEAILNQALRNCDLHRESLTHTKPYVKLDFPDNFFVECLTGQERVIAAQESLNSPDLCWMIDLFIAGAYCQQITDL